ncbi:hypothetical protein B9Z55_018310 [Caenorhabditis nigoni]|uniref:Uncharacterized protein n=1 Tax=Caenorhabditis nigoni TaxID=1611254 RepID=A0A2G5TDB6_9PELO|nr:hypothetical protein B9Z55_018310 [Caenorhabditis nigoni]
MIFENVFVLFWKCSRSSSLFLLAIPTGSRQILVAELVTGFGSTQHFWMPGQLESIQHPIVVSWNTEMPSGRGQDPDFELISDAGIPETHYYVHFGYLSSVCAAGAKMQKVS